MMRLVRNAVDHGIEPPLERAPRQISHRNPPPQGLSQGNQVILEMTMTARKSKTRRSSPPPFLTEIIAAGRASRLTTAMPSNSSSTPGLGARGHRSSARRRDRQWMYVKAVIPGIARRAPSQVRSITGEGTTVQPRRYPTLPGHHQGPALLCLSSASIAVPPGQCAENFCAHAAPKSTSVDGQEVVHSW